VWVLVLALLNPLCCHLMPHFQADPHQESLCYSEKNCKCAGKPEAVFDAPLILSVSLLAEPLTRTLAVALPRDLLLAQRLPGGDPPTLAPPLRILFRVFRI
jgi:hypothetical protein